METSTLIQYFTSTSRRTASSIRFQWGTIVAAFVAFWIALASSAQSEDAKAPDEVPKPPSPADELKSFTLAPGIEFQLVASEPLVQQPISMSFDDSGRLWVLQYRQYPHPNGLKAVSRDLYLRTEYDRIPEPPPRGPKGADRISILEDTNGDGLCDSERVFLDDLNLASGMALGYDGVFVLQSPYLLFYPDKNHDHKPDRDPDVLLQGFGMQDAHAFANSLTWGPDGWLYGAQGSTVTARIRGIEFQQGIWRYHPVTREFELFAEGGGNTWGIDFDQHGQLFAGGNTAQPLCHHVQGAYYVKGFEKHGALHNPYAYGYFEPVQHLGFLGSALTGGFTIDQGGLLPERFRGTAIYPNLRANAMRVSQMKPKGSTFVTEFQEDFVTSTDRWFRIVDSLTGPDGALYCADWYDYHIAHSSAADKSQYYLPHLESGRIWRVVPQGTARPTNVSATLPTEIVSPLRNQTSEQLIGLLTHTNAWYSREARRLLSERRDAAVAPRLWKLVQDTSAGSNPRLNLEALWSLYVSGGLTEEMTLALMDHPVDHVRSWAIRLAGDQKVVSTPLGIRLVQLAKSETSVVVRNQLACTCKRLPGILSLPIVAKLLNRDEDVSDTQIPLLLWWAIEDKAISDRDAVLQLVDAKSKWERPIVKSTIVTRLARRYLAEGNRDGYASCTKLIRGAPTDEQRYRLFEAMNQELDGSRVISDASPLNTEVATFLSANNPPSWALLRLSLRLGINSAFPLVLKLAADSNSPIKERSSLVQLLGIVKHPDALNPLLEMLKTEKSDELRSIILLAVQNYRNDEISQKILEVYPTFGPVLQDQARDVLLSRPAWCQDLLNAVESGVISPKQFSVSQILGLASHADPNLMKRAETLGIRANLTADKTEETARITAILKSGVGIAAKGKEIANKTCLNCHQLHGVGKKVGPDLTGADRRNLDVLIRNIVDPSIVIREGYVQYVVEAEDGRVLVGTMAEQPPNRVLIVDAKGNQTVLAKEEIASSKQMPISMMPEGLLKSPSISDQDIRDLFQYLRSDQVSSAKK